MRPDNAPHLYEPSMVPNLLPFFASVTTGGGSTQIAAAIPQTLPGFAAMLGTGTTPVTQSAAGTTISDMAPVTVAILPPPAAPLLGLTDGEVVQPVETALPELLSIADPAPGIDTPTDVAPQPDSVPVMPAAAPAPVAAPRPPVTPDASAPSTPGDAAAPASTPESKTVITADEPRKTAEPVAVPAAAAVIEVDGPPKSAEPAAPAPPVKPAAPPPTDDGTLPSADEPPERYEIDTEAGSVVTTIAPPFKVVDPAPVSELQDGPVKQVVEPVRATPDPAPSPIGETVSVTEEPRQEPDRVAATPATPTDIAPVPTLAEPAETEIAPNADPLVSAPTPDAPAPLASPVAIAAASLPMPAPAKAGPTPAQPVADAATAAVAAPRSDGAGRAKAVPAEIAIDPAVDDGAFDELVDADPASATEALHTVGDAPSDATNRDGNRQPPQQPQQSAPASAPAAAGPIPAFDPLAAPAPDAPRATSDAAAEPRARASAIGEDVGLAIVRHADTGSGDVLVIRLDPAELGKIEVRLRMDEARQLSAEVTADQPATLELLRRDSDSLTRALSDAGFRADDQSLRFDSRGFGQSDQQAQQGRRIASRAYLPQDDAVAAQSIPTPVQVRSSGRVDLVA